MVSAGEVFSAETIELGASTLCFVLGLTETKHQEQSTKLKVKPTS